MEDKELLAAISAMMEPMKKQLDELQAGQGKIEGRLDTVEESLGEVCTGVNALIEWSEGVGEKFDMPLRPAQ